MSNVEAIKKALEGVTPGTWHVEGKKYRGNFSVAWKPELKVCQTYGDSLAAENNAEYIASVNPVAISELLTTLEALQRENERLQAEIDRKSSMPGDHRYWEGRYRDEAAENELFRAALVEIATNDEYRILSAEEAQSVAQKALASAGEEHHD